MLYTAEAFTPDEEEVLRRYFTNLDQPVFALVNLPEVVKGALFARYSRSPKSLRRLFLDEFVGELDIAGDATIDATVGLRRAEELYDRVFFEYGDDSVAQLGGVHLACEQASNVLTKVLEWGRLMAYLEQSTRYIAYDTRLDGRYRYWRDPEVLDSRLGARYVAAMDALFDGYAAALPKVMDWARQTFPKEPGDSDVVWRQTIKAKACDAVRGMLPAATQSNVGLYGSGQAFEALLLRMRAHPLMEARECAKAMLEELRKVIPAFLTRVDISERGGRWSEYLAGTRHETTSLADAMLQGITAEDRAEVTLTDFDPDGEIKIVASALYGSSDLPDDQLQSIARRMSADDRARVLRAYVGTRSNRRHKPGRAFERTTYRFDILTDYGAFRDLQRHRLLTLEWQPLTTRHGFTEPEAIREAGAGDDWDRVLEASASLYERMASANLGAAAQYAVAMAYRIRFYMEMNAREAMHLIELRTAPQGHPAYRRVCQQMHHLIAEKAGHRAVADAMTFADHSAVELERLGSERTLEKKRSQTG